MLESRARRIPLVTNDSQTDRSHVLSVITQYRILKFVAVNVSDTQKLRRPLGELLLGTYNNIATASMDTPVIDVIHILVERSISSVPILNSEGMSPHGLPFCPKPIRINANGLESTGVVYNVFEAVDVIALIRGGVYDDLGLTVGEVLKKRSPVCFVDLARSCHDFGKAYSFIAGIPRNLHLFAERWTRYHFRHHPQIPGPSSSGGG